MTTATDVEVRTGGAGRSVRPFLRANGWTVGVWILLAAIIAWYAMLIPQFGSFQVSSIAKNSLPIAYLAIGQAVIVIAGGIDLSIGAMMLLSSAVAAQTMQGRSFAATLAIGGAIVVGAAILDAIVGLVIDVSRVPDIVVTLATSFVWSGAALLVLPSPGGGTSPGFRRLFTGSEVGIGDVYLPSIIMLVIPTLIGFWFLRRTRTGLALHATGSDRVAAYLAGVDTRRARIVSYAVGGAFAGLAGLATIAITGTGDPRASLGAQLTLRSVAAVVLGGVALTGGVGSVIGVVAAAIVLGLVMLVLSAVGVDPNTSQVVQGVLIAAVMMVAGLAEWRRRRRA
jgi:ribose transport system permease protein